MKEVASSINLQNELKKDNPDGFSSKMSQVFSTATMGTISNKSSKGWMNSGMAFHGEFSMQNILEHPRGAVESTLSQVLEASAPLTYFLTPSQLQSLQERASARKTSLPPEMEAAYQLQISILSSMPELEESLQQAPKQKATETMEKPTHSTAEDVLTLYVRRMMPLECERLQGFPENWTEIDIEL